MWLPHTATVRANQVDDVMRALNVQGDGRSPESSQGMWLSATNLVTNGGLETNTTGWTAVGSTLTRDTGEFKFGVASGKIVTDNAAANEGGYHDFTATAAVYTISCWVKGASGTVRVGVKDGAGANAQNGATITLDGTWQKATLITTALTVATWRAYVETTAQQSITYYYDGMQAELRGFATPYVETNGGTASRTASTCSLPLLSYGGNTTLDETQGWVAIRFRIGYAQGSTHPANTIAFQWVDDGSNFIILQRTATTTWQCQRRAAAVGGAAAAALAFSINDKFTIIGKWTATTVSVSINGATFVDAANTAIPTLGAAIAYIGNGQAAGQLCSDIFWAALGRGTLTDADAASIYAYGDADLKPHNFPGTSLCQVVYPANASMGWRKN